MPGFFGKQSSRLMRDFWHSAQQLAEELFAMFGEDVPMETDQPLILNRNGNQPAIIIRDRSGRGDDPIRVIRNGDSTGYGRGYGGGTGDTGTGDTGDQGQTQATARPAGYPGRVESGTGDTYQVALYKDGYSHDPTDVVTVKQLQISNDATIPAGTKVFVGWTERVLPGGLTVTREYFMQVPVWLE